jgi:hypothetical protein
MRITASILRIGPAQFTSWGSRLPSGLYDTNETMSPGLVTRLHRYALRALIEAGFEVGTWDCEVYTMGADLPRSERVYTVEFTNTKGGMLGVQGIHMHRGHPFLDHGICCDVGRKTISRPHPASPENTHVE